MKQLVHWTISTFSFRSSIHVTLFLTYPHPKNYYRFLFDFRFICFLISSCCFFIFFLYPGFTVLVFLTFFHASESVLSMVFLRRFRSFHDLDSFHSPFFTSQNVKVIPFCCNFSISFISRSRYKLITVPSIPARAVRPERWI